jgi:hypothetical protein
MVFLSSPLGVPINSFSLAVKVENFVGRMGRFLKLLDIFKVKHIMCHIPLYR